MEVVKMIYNASSTTQSPIHGTNGDRDSLTTGSSPAAKMNRVCKVAFCGNQTLFGNMICTECERVHSAKIVEVIA